MAEQTQQRAFEGGDTHPDTAKVIHERNQAMQELVDAKRAHKREADAKKQELYLKGRDVQAKIHADVPALATGTAVGEPNRPVGEGSSANPPAQPKVKKD